ncbi:uncharacterized protein ZBAI_02619 [Zygosaccharomyces bailii ISA1307]|nr:uncharacterized protein ZBAI_02619 [Zygosaccharomyces bailii ISA1307]
MKNRITLSEMNNDGGDVADGSPTMWRVRGKISGRAPSSGRKQKLEVRRTRRAGCTDGTKIVDVDTAPNLTNWPVEHGLLSHKRAEVYADQVLLPFRNDYVDMSELYVAA